MIPRKTFHNDELRSFIMHRNIKLIYMVSLTLTGLYPFTSVAY